MKAYKKFTLWPIALTLFLLLGSQKAYAAIPSIPSDFTATSFDGSTATLHWSDNSGDEDNFNIYYATSDVQPGSPSYTPAANATSQAVTGLSSTLDNFFWISAENTDGESSVQKICLKWAGQANTLRKCGTTNGFGIAANVAVDGDFAVITEYSDDEGGSRAGAAYVMRRNGDTWVEVKKLIASDSAADDWFGSAADIRGDYVIVGSPRDDDGGSGSGSAYVFEKDFGGVDNWGERKKLIASDDAAADGFGYTVAIDTDTAVVGSGGDDDNGSGSGSAYIFYKDTGGADNWGQFKKINPSDGAAGDSFGTSGMGLDGDILVVSANLNDDVGSNSGSSYIFERDFGGADNWGERKKLTASDAASGDRFGFSVDTDGTSTIIGCYDCTSAYLFEKDFGGADNWGERKILDPKETASGFDWYGWDVSVDGDYALVGDWGDTQSGFSDAGISWLFEKDRGGADNWGGYARLLSPSPNAGAHFGVGVSVEANDIVIGANFDDSIGSGFYWDIGAFVASNAPSDFIATSFSGTTAGVSWTDNATDETGFYIYQANTSTQPEKPSRVNDADATSNTVFSLSTTLPNYIWITSIKEIESTPVQICIRNSGVSSKLIACDGQADDRFGERVGMSGDYAVVGTSSDDDQGADAGAAYIYQRSGTTWTEIKKIYSSDIAAGDEFGKYVAIDGDYVVIGAPGDDDNGSASGSVYIFEKDFGGSGNWGERKKVTASDGAASDAFGTEVDIDGSFAIIGASLNDGTGADTGSAYIFERDFGSANNWGERKKLTASDETTDDDQFGIDVTISGDLAVVGAWQDNPSGGDSGSAYVFEKDFGGSDNWGERKKLTASDGATTDLFGASVDLDGTRVVVGAYQDDDTAADSGSAYIFEQDFGGTDNWGERKKLTSSSPTASDFFGEFVGIDGTNVVINGTGAQTVFNFGKDEGGTDNWGEVVSFSASDGAAGDEFANLSIDGTDVLVGAPGDDDSGSESGSFYAYDLNNFISSTNKVSDPLGVAFEDFGASVDVDGSYAIVGKPNFALFTTGKAFIYKKNATSGFWDPKFTISGPGGELLGHGAAISGDYAVVGLPAGGVGFAGEAQVYKRITDTSWSLVDTLTASDSAGGDAFGWAVDIEGDYMIISASQFAGTSTGKAYIFERDTGMDTWSETKILTASDATAGHLFGASVAIDAPNAIVGADYSGTDSSGAAYLFNEDTGGVDNWGEVHKFTASNGGAADKFGTDVGIDGTYAVVGAPDYDAGADTGRVHVFKDTAGVWAESDSFQATDAAAGFLFGQSVDIVGDVAVVGSENADGIGTDNEGKAYIFERDSGLETWSQSQTFTASDGLNGDDFGNAIAMTGVSPDYDIFVGAPSATGATADTGAAYSFSFTESAGIAPGTTAASPKKSCSINPIKLNLSENLEVAQQDGKSVVRLNWNDAQSRDATAASKIQILFDYLDQEPTPELDSSDKTLESVMTRHIYNEIYHSDNALLVDLFKEKLKKLTAQESNDTLQILSSVGIEYENDYFSDWWIHLLINKLRSEPIAASTFISGVDTTLKSNQFSYQTLIRNLLRQFSKIEKSPQELEAAQCIGDAVAGMSLNDFIPGQGENIYGRFDSDLGNLLTQMKKGGGIASTFSSLKQDQRFLNNTASSLKVGINALFFSWANDGKVQRVIDFYQTDDNFKEFRKLFFRTELIKEMESCLKNTYKRELIESVNEVRSSLVQKAIEQNEICDDHTSKVMLDVLKELLQTPSAKEDTEAIILKFINELLSVEKHLADATTYRDSFTDYFNSNYVPPFKNAYDDLSLEIFRDGQLIYSIDNPSFTSYIDETVPQNTSNRIKTHKYFIRTSTACDSKQGSEGKADIDPQLNPGTSIDVDADVKLNLKNGFNLLFIEKLEALVQAAMKNNQEGLTQEPGPDPYGSEPSEEQNLCEQSRQVLNATGSNSSTVMRYILACHGSLQINPSLELRQLKIVPPILLALKLNSTEDESEIIDQFVRPTIDELTKEISQTEELFSQVGGQLAHLDMTQGISGFDETEKELIKCAGVPSCDQEMKDRVLAYFKGSSHAADLSIEVYDEAGSQIYQTDASSDIFGEIESLELGQFLSGRRHTIKIRLKDERFVLPKLSTFTPNTAQPKSGGGFQANLNLVYNRPFRYGNFDESNDIIDKNDILVWGKLISEDPELWDDSNLDGLYGVDLLDFITFQQNWGEIQESQVEESQVTLMELAGLFGLITSSETKVQVPSWLSLLELSCKN